jgi:hypothetical protein
MRIKWSFCPQTADLIEPLRFLLSIYWVDLFAISKGKPEVTILLYGHRCSLQDTKERAWKATKQKSPEVLSGD